MTASTGQHAIPHSYNVYAKMMMDFKTVFRLSRITSTDQLLNSSLF